jgi:hypothetical protein
MKKTQRLNQLQIMFIKKICFLLLAQLALLLVIVSVVHKYFPKKVCLFMCNFWVDILCFIAIAFGLIVLSSYKEGPIVLRYLAFFGLAALAAYVLGIQYNQISMANKNEQKTADSFFKALMIVISIFVITLIMLPLR